MASKHRCEVPIQLDIPRKLKLDFNACADFQEEAKISIDAFFYRIQQINRKYDLKPDVLDADGNVVQHFPVPPEATIELTNSMGMNYLRILLWAGLRHEDPEMTIKRAGELVEEAEGDSVTEQFAFIVSKICDAYAMRQVGGKDKKKAKD
jgi:hypothetical protein